MTRFSYDRLYNFSTLILQKCGLVQKDASMASAVLVESDLRGVHTHGVSRLPMYRQWYEKCVLNSRPNFRIIESNETRAILDGDNGLGLVSCVKAMQFCIEEANLGIYTVALRNTNHTGMLAYYALMALESQKIGIAMSTAGPNVAPYGGIKPLLGANPIAVAIPCGSYPPLVFDASTSIVARGKIILAAKESEDIPLGWALDKDGNPTTNPVEALKGAVLPMAGAKGYGLGLILEVLTKLLTDSNTNGTLLMAINIGQFLPVDRFKIRMDGIVEMIKNSKPMKNFDKVRIPGENSWRKSIDNRKDGVDLKQSTIAELDELAIKLEVDTLTS